MVDLDGSLQGESDTSKIAMHSALPDNVSTHISDNVTTMNSTVEEELDNDMGTIHQTLAKEANLYKTLAQAVFKETEEDVYEAEKIVREVSYGDVHSTQQLKLERDRTKLRRSQALIHVSYTDMRIEVLESQVKALRKLIKDLPEDFVFDKLPKNPVFKHSFELTDFQRFEIDENTKTIPCHLRPALEGLVSSTNTHTITSDKTDSASDSSPRLIVERLRIRAFPLLEHLDTITGQATAISKSTAALHSVANPSAFVMIQPFKTLVTFNESIRASEIVLKKKLDDTKATRAADASNAQQVKDGRDDSAETVEMSVPENDHKHSKLEKEYDDEDLLQDLRLLINFMDIYIDPLLELRKRVKAGTQTDIHFHELWHLFHVGDDITKSADLAKNHVRAFRILNVTGGRDILSPQLDPGGLIQKANNGFIIDAYNLEFDGRHFGPRLHHFSIPKFQGPRPIKSLPVFPLNWASTSKSPREHLLEQGQRYLDIISSSYSHKTFIGRTLDDSPEEIDAQVIVDVAMALNRNPKWQTDLRYDESQLTAPDLRETRQQPHCKHTYEGCCGSDVIEPDLKQSKTDLHQYLKVHGHRLGPLSAADLVDNDKVLLPDWVYGFVLRNRQWVAMQTKDLFEVQYRNTFESLVLPKEYQQTVQALVVNHAKDASSESQDKASLGSSIELVRGKGKGLIILLHGDPGVGKTSTAECVADLTKRPLFPVTCGDIGETASEVQTNLDSSFQLAHRWGCVLLLDEADVFMSKRNKSDLRRNAVVSIFLRTLEYYSGILFLTTNRVGTIDLAFKSRIHVALRYPRLELKATMKLYKLLIARTIAEQKEANRLEFEVDEKEILRFARRHFRSLDEDAKLATWNGRQIRNAFQTAIALAEYDSRQPRTDKIVLGKAQFVKVAKASKEFDEYMTQTQGATEAQLAHREQLRYDASGTLHQNPIMGTSFDAKIDKRYTKKKAISYSDSSSEETSEEDSDDNDDSDEDSDEDDDPGTRTASNKKSKSRSFVEKPKKKKKKSGSKGIKSKEESSDEDDSEESEDIKKPQKKVKTRD